MKLWRISVPNNDKDETIYCRAVTWFEARAILQRIFSGDPGLEILWRTGFVTVESVPAKQKLYFIDENRQLTFERVPGKSPKKAKRS